MNFLDYEFYKPAHVTGNKEGIYINPCNCEALLDIREAANFNNIDFTGCNDIAVNRNESGNFYIFQVSGYTYEEGLFCHMIPEKPTSKKDYKKAI